MDPLTLGKVPVAPDKPAGTDVRYDPAFEELQAEIDKVGNPSASGGVDWAKVGKLSSEILAQKSKDLLVASYLAVSLLYTKKVEGLAIGLKVYRDLLETYWETLFPAKVRLRGRIAAIEWWVEKAETALSGIEPKGIPPERMTAVREDFDRISDLMGDYFEDPPSLRPLLEYVRNLEAASQEAEKPAPPPLQTAQSPPGVAVLGETVVTPPTPPQSGTVIPEIAVKDDVPKVLSMLAKRARDAASFLRNEDLGNPLAYRLARWAAWVEVDDLPTVMGGKTITPPPMPWVFSSLEGFRSMGNYPDLLRESEAALSSCIFWLDLGRFSTEALSALGPPYKRAQEAVCQETALFVSRFPGIEEMSFSDGKPFADPDTRQWLKEIALSAGGQAAGATSGPGAAAEGGLEAEIREELGRVLPLVRQGKAVEGVEAIAKRVRGGRSEKERILWRIALVQSLLAGRQGAVAWPHVEQLLADVEGFRLEAYEPAVALRILRLAWVVADAQEEPAFKARGAEIQQRIARVDPVEAMRLGKGHRG